MISKNMIFRNTLFGVAVCLAGVLTACAEKELSVVEPVVEEQQVEICFAPTVGADISTKGSDIQPLGESGLYLRTIVSENISNPFDEVATRATLVNGFDPDGAEGTYSTFRVYSFLHDGTWEDNSDNATPYINGIDAVSLGNGYWGFEESVFWPSWDTNMTFLSYAAPEDSGVEISFTEEDASGESVYAAPTLVYSDPAIANLDSDGAITADGLAAQYDLLVAQTADLTKETTTIPMSFSHVFTSVQFLCGNMSGGKISKLSLVNIAHEGVYDFGTGTWDVDTDNRTEYVFPLEVTVPETEGDVDLDNGDTMTSYDTNILGGSSALMMVPQDLTGCALLLEYTPTDDTEPMELAVELHGEWEAGAHITYHISFIAGEEDILPYLTGTDGIFATYVLSHFDADGDEHVSQKEADLVTELKIGYYPNDDESQTSTTTIDFTGIEYFTNLEKFTSNRAKGELDFSQNPNLEYVVLGSEQTNVDDKNTYASSITTINLSNNTALTKLPDDAFRGCTSLQTVNLPESLEEIGKRAFYGVYGSNNASSLQSIELPVSVKEIGEYAFYDCRSLKEINIDKTKVTELNDYTFYNCTKQLESITLPDNMTKIGKNVFQTCTSLVSINMPAYLKELGDNVFSGCTKLNPDGGVVLPEGLEVIGDNAFYNCTALDAVTLPSTLTKIGDKAFQYQSSGTNKINFTIPESGFTDLLSIGSYAFYYCSNLTSFPFGDKLTAIGADAFYYCTSLTTVSGFPSTLQTIGERAFQGCSVFADPVVLPEGFTTVEQYIFAHCPLVPYIDLPSTIEGTIGTYAFEDTKAVTRMIVRAETPPALGTWHSINFAGGSNTDNSVPLYVPDDYISSYSNDAHSTSLCWGTWDNTAHTYAYFSGIYPISQLATDFPDEYDGDGTVSPTGNYDTYTNGGGITIGDKTYTYSGSENVVHVSSDGEISSLNATGANIVFIDPGLEVTFTYTGSVAELVLVGNDPNGKSTVKFTGTTRVNLNAQNDENSELVFYNLDLDLSGMTTYLAALNAEGAFDYLAFVDCHVTAQEASSSAATKVTYYSTSGRYYNNVVISGCVWNLPSTTSLTEYIFQFNAANSSYQGTLSLTNNVFYCNGTESDFRIFQGTGMTLGDVVYKNNTLVNLASSANGVFEYGSITNVDAEWNLTYDESLNTHYVFFRPYGTSDVPTGTVKVADNIAYRGTDTTYGWYWFYGEESSSWTAPSGFTACEVLTTDPFSSGTLDLTTETFIPNSTYSDYGYQETN